MLEQQQMDMILNVINILLGVTVLCWPLVVLGIKAILKNKKMTPDQKQVLVTIIKGIFVVLETQSWGKKFKNINEKIMQIIQMAETEIGEPLTEEQKRHVAGIVQALEAKSVLQK